MAVIKNNLTEEEKSFLLGRGYWSEHDMKAFPEYSWYKLSDYRYIPVVCAEDWLKFRAVKTGNLYKDFEWWVYDAAAKYGIFKSDLEDIKENNYTYEEFDGDTTVRDFIKWMKTA